MLQKRAERNGIQFRKGEVADKEKEKRERGRSDDEIGRELPPELPRQTWSIMPVATPSGKGSSRRGCRQFHEEEAEMDHGKHISGAFLSINLFEIGHGRLEIEHEVIAGGRARSVKDRA
ncbi:hypothetical protein Cni_G09485 [Canna indica]|uniref:Uncharacterized protein n=1 Tax=Canna indica TaxID=4628 RepID=A0AAQ3K2L0_9LILI|nr:hypothetical protein Cni_G09485 [Canna indica]